MAQVPGSSVGRPMQEAVLTQSLLASAPKLVQPGPGRSLYAILEPDIGRGRPDVVLLVVSPARLQSHIRRGLRLANWTAARALDSSIPDSDLGVSEKHARHVRRELVRMGWLANNRSELRRVVPVVAQSVAIEVKVRDWRQAVRQAAYFSGFCHENALMLPQHVVDRIPPTITRMYNLSLLGEENGRVGWTSRAAMRAPSLSAQYWLLELLVRGLEKGSAHKFSDSAKISRAARKLSIREE